MRRLWITRKKAIAGCAAKVRFYIEDPENGDITINGVPCRKLGSLKNGEQKRFRIDNEAAKVFVIGDKLTRNVYNEFYQLEYGQDDVFLTGKNRLDPMGGNMFRFDGVTDKAALDNRKKSQGRGRVVVIASVLVGLLLGCIAGKAAVDAIFSASQEPLVFLREGMHITLTEEYERLDVEGYTVSYGTSDTAVFLLKEEFSLAEGFGDLPLEEYGQLVLKANNHIGTVELKVVEGLLCFEYDFQNPENGQVNHYFTTVHKGPDAFWTCQFICLAEDAEEFRPQFIAFAKSVGFTED